MFSNNYIKVSSAAGNALPAEMVDGSIRGPRALSDAVARAMANARSELEKDNPQAGGASMRRVWSWVFPFHTGDQESIALAMQQACHVEHELTIRQLPAHRSVYREVRGIDLPSVVP